MAHASQSCTLLPPVRFRYDPAGHASCWAATDPAPHQYPAAHSPLTVPSSQYIAAGHAVQSLGSRSPDALLHVPAGHVTPAALPPEQYAPTGQGSGALVLCTHTFPAGHGSHASNP